MTMNDIRQAPIEKFDLNSASQEELHEVFRSYFVSSKLSPLSVSSHYLARAYRFQLHVNISGEASDSYNSAILLMKHLKMPFTQNTFTPQIAKDPISWSKQPSGQSLNVWIPGQKASIFDLGAATNFLIRFNLAKLRRRVPTFPEPEIDLIYLPYLWKECYDSDSVKLGERIFRDLLLVENFGVLTVFDMSTGWNSGYDKVYRKVQELSESCQMYLGFCSQMLENDGTNQIQQLSDHQLNQINSEQLARQRAISLVSQPGSRTYIPPKNHFPRYSRQFYCKLSDLETVTENMLLLETGKLRFLEEQDREKVNLYLRSRIIGKSESEISELLGFTSMRDYEFWVNHNHLSVVSNRESDSFERWKWAIRMLGIKLIPPPELKNDFADWFEEREPKRELTPDSSLSEPIRSSIKPEEIRQFSSDFRSVNISGTQYTLTARQAEVIQILYDNAQQGTEWIGQASVIESVYGAVKENRLRKQFANLALFDLIVERNKKSKGLVRLRSGFTVSETTVDSSQRTS